MYHDPPYRNFISCLKNKVEGVITSVLTHYILNVFEIPLILDRVSGQGREVITLWSLDRRGKRIQ